MTTNHAPTLKSLLANWVRPQHTVSVGYRRYSTTGDVLSFKRCRRQYGYFGARGFNSSTNTQRYFGTLVHDVLDQIHRDYKVSASLPDKALIDTYIDQAHNRLIRSGVRPFSAGVQKDTASRLVDRFVRLVGPSFFPHVKLTEYKLERLLHPSSGREYVLEGVVDVLAGSVSHELGLNFATEPDDVEIWDYKSGDRPEKGDRIMRDYEYQLRVYAELYRQQTGEYPARCALAFLGELDNKELWDEKHPDLSRFGRLFYVIHPEPAKIDLAMQDFHDTVQEIESERLKPYAQQWLAPAHDVDDQTCEACSIRFNCERYPQGAKQLLTPL